MTTTQFPRIGDIIDGLPVGALMFDQRTGKPYAVLSGPAAEEKMSWDDAMAWAASLGPGFRLPLPIEGRPLFENNDKLGDAAFERDWYWLSEQYSARYAWGQSFGVGDQGDLHKDVECRARAIRRFDLSNGS